MAELFEHGYALLVGIDENQISRLALPTVAKDVKAVHDVLVHPERCAFKPDNVKMLTGAESTKNNILEGFVWLKAKVHADPHATAVIYYSGHGYRDTATEEYYLIPYDFQSVARVRIDALPAEVVATEIAEIQSERVLVILDCCHAEGMQAKDLGDDSGPALKSVAFPESVSITKNLPTYTAGSKNVTALSEGNGRAVLNSSTGSESSYVRSDRKMSVFTYHLIEALTGHAPHDENDTVVVVTDVMSWVYRRVKETAAAMNVPQTPVMHTSNVFPIAQLIGGEGVAKGLGGVAPDPLAPLPTVAVTVQGDDAIVATGDNATINKKEGGIHFGDGNQVQIDGPLIGGDQNISGDNVQGNKYGGDHVEGDKFNGDKVMGNKVEGDSINVGNISGSGIAIGRGASANVSTTYGSGGSVDFGQLFAPLQTVIAQNAPAQSNNVNVLKAEVEKGAGADDKTVADLIFTIGTAVPSAKSILQQIFNNPAAAEATGAISQFMLEKL